MPAPPSARRTLDFFDAQAKARRNTGVLVLLFVLAWLATILLADLGLTFALGVDPITLFLPVTAIVTLVVLAGSGPSFCAGADLSGTGEQAHGNLRFRQLGREALARIEDGTYGWCEETGEPIGIARLLARPTATMSVEAQARRELKQKMYG